MALFLDLLVISAILISFTFLYGGFKRYIPMKSGILSEVVNGSLFSAIGLLGMIIPVELAPGVIMDGRTVVVALATVFGGAVSGIMTALSTGTYRFILGGFGRNSGLLAIALAIPTGMLFRFMYRKKGTSTSILIFLLLGLLSSELGLFTALLLPDWEIAKQVFWKALVPINLFYPFIAVFLGYLLKREIKNIEIQLALIESERKYKNIVENSTEIHFQLDSEGRIQYISNSVFEITGYKEEELLGTLTHSQFYTSPVDHEKYLNEIFDKGSVCNFEEYLLKKDKTHWWASTNARIIKDVNGTVVGYEGSIRDITESKKMKALMVQNEKMLSVGGLAAGMAHEINNPLAGIMQSVSVISNRLTNTELKGNIDASNETDIKLDNLQSYLEKREIIRMLNSAKDSGKRMSSIIENMLDFSRKRDNSVSTNNPIDLVDNVLSLAATDFDLKKKYDFKKIEIVKEYQKDIPLIKCEREGIEQVLLNILRNGAHAMMFSENKEISAPHFIIRIYTESGTDRLVIEIEDNGPGMEESIKNRIFEPFYTTKKLGEGTGLGLSVSYYIITDTHGGTLRVESELGIGTKFIISLPLD